MLKRAPVFNALYLFQMEKQVEKKFFGLTCGKGTLISHNSCSPY